MLIGGKWSNKNQPFPFIRLKERFFKAKKYVFEHDPCQPISIFHQRIMDDGSRMVTLHYITSTEVNVQVYVKCEMEDLQQNLSTLEKII